MIIFDSFPSRENAEKFASAVSARFNRQTHVCDSKKEADAVDPHPFNLFPPIVMVERLWPWEGATQDDCDKDLQIEREIEESVTQFCGEYVGT
jgi:hypothetical protein